MLSEVNKVKKDNPIFVIFLLYLLLPPAYFDPPFINFSNFLKPPPPPFSVNLRVYMIKSKTNVNGTEWSCWHGGSVLYRSRILAVTGSKHGNIF